MKKSSELAVLILAAGTSSRLGKPKQLVKYLDDTLIENAIKKALKISDNVIVVLGNKENIIRKRISHYPISIIVNENYNKGIGNSISYASEYITNYEQTLIMLCDMPFIPLEHLEKIHKKFMEKKQIICSKYNNIFSVPALFPKKYYSELKKLDNDIGAKNIILKNEHESILLDEKLAIDIDTKKDLEFLNSM